MKDGFYNFKGDEGTVSYYMELAEHLEFRFHYNREKEYNDSESIICFKNQCLTSLDDVDLFNFKKIKNVFKKYFDIELSTTFFVEQSCLKINFHSKYLKRLNK